MTPREFLRAYWRIVLLTIIVSVALYALFVPGGVFADTGDGQQDGEDVEEQLAQHNLVFGLGLDGGTRISAPVVGMTAENIDLDRENPDASGELESHLRTELDLEPGDTIVRDHGPDEGHTAEVFDRNVSQSEFEGALESGGVDMDRAEVRSGVTQETRDENIDTISTKVDEAGLAGARVYQSSTLGGNFFIVVEVPDMPRAELQALLEERGVVHIDAYYPEADGDNHTQETVLEREDMDRVGTASFDDRQDVHYVPIVVSDERAEEFQNDLNRLTFTDPGGTHCDYENETAAEDKCLLTIKDGEVVDAHSMGPDLADTMRTGQWATDPQFRMLAPSQADADSLSINLRAGALRAPLDFENAQSFTIEPALADQFKVYSLLIGVLSVIAVSGMVYLRYTDVRVAVPMIVTAMSEVVILLGFAAAIQMPLDLAHAAGLIAVIGTGVDDLIIIADEVMSEGDVKSRMVFQSRFRKAFWVIGAAAATTIVAMSPLAVMDLGDLQGFAIITILGVLVGVLITRPAYGDILRWLMTEEK